MVFLKILAIIVLVFVLIGFIKLGVSFDCIDDRIRLGAIILGLKIQLLPKKNKNKEKKPKQEKPPEEKKPKPVKVKKPKKGKKKSDGLWITFDDVINILKKVFKGLGKVTGGFNVERFLMHLVVATNDPYKTAVTLGKINAGLNILAPICDERFNCKDVDVWTDCDFNSSLPRLDIGFDITIRIHCFFRMINTILFGVLGTAISIKARMIWLKITDKKEYLYEKELRDEKSAKLHGFIDKLKESKAGKDATSDDKELKEISNG